MSKDDKGYSSYPELQQHFNSWRSFASADPAPLNEGISHAMSSLRVGKGQSEKAVPAKGEVTTTAFAEFMRTLTQINERTAPTDAPVNDEQLMNDFQAFLRAQGFVVEGMDVDPGKYADMAERQAYGSMEYDKDSGPPLLGDLKEMVENYKLFGPSMVRACQSKYIKAITIAMKDFGFGDVREFLEQVKALTPAQEEAPENDLLKRLLAELVQAGTLEDWGAIWEQLRKTLEKEDASEPWERILAGLKEIKEKARTEAEATENLEELAKVILQLGIEDQAVNRAAAQQFIKLAWAEFFEGAEYGAGEEEEDLIQKLLKTRDLDEFGEVYAELATKTNKENRWEKIYSFVRGIAKDAVKDNIAPENLSDNGVIQTVLKSATAMVSKFDYNETPGSREHFKELANQFLKMALESDANQGEETPFDLAAAVSSLPKTRKVWEMLVKAAPKKEDEKFKKIFTSEANFQNDVEAYVKFIKPFSSQSNASIKEDIVPGPKTINNIGMRQVPLFMKMIGENPPGKTANAWPDSPFKKSADAMKEALANLQGGDQAAYNSVLRITAALMSNVRVRNTSGNRKNKSKFDQEARKAIAKGRKSELLKLVSKIQNSAQDSTEQPTPGSVKPPQGADKNVSFADKGIERDTPRQQVAETLDRWKTLAGIITESEEK